MTSYSMEQSLHKNVAEVNGQKGNWMIEVGRMSRTSERLVIRHFTPTSTNIAFVKSISLQNRFFIQSYDQDLVLEKHLISA